MRVCLHAEPKSPQQALQLMAIKDVHEHSIVYCIVFSIVYSTVYSMVCMVYSIVYSLYSIVNIIAPSVFQLPLGRAWKLLDHSRARAAISWRLTPEGSEPQSLDDKSWNVRKHHLNPKLA